MLAFQKYKSLPLETQILKVRNKMQYKYVVRLFWKDQSLKTRECKRRVRHTLFVFSENAEPWKSENTKRRVQQNCDVRLVNSWRS